MAAVLIEPMSESGSLTDHIIYFEKKFRDNSWDSSRKAKEFRLSLLANNKSLLDGLSAKVLESYPSTKEAVLGKTKPIREKNFAELLHISWNEIESLEAFNMRVEGLVKDIYPSYPKHQPTITRDFFVNGLPLDYQNFIWCSKSDKNKDALSAAEKYFNKKQAANECNAVIPDKNTTCNDDTAEITVQFEGKLKIHTPQPKVKGGPGKNE